MYLINKKGEHEPVEPYGPAADPEQVAPAGYWIADREKYGRREHWYSVPLMIDTETSHQGEDIAWIHQWAISWGYQGSYIIGRTARELIDFLVRVSEWAQRRGKGRSTWKVLCYIHNMGYDMEYLRQFFPDQEPEFFAVKPHRILTAKWGNLEIRCSYLLTQKSLAQWGQDSAHSYNKLIGAYDYDRTITPADKLSSTDWAYQLGDCATMSDAWYHDRLQDGYTAATVPLTATGFVRADCRAAAQADYSWRPRLDAMQPNIEVYNALEYAFMGGYTHGNRFHKNQTISGPIGHRDFTSSYPARMMMNLFPMGQFTPAGIKSMTDVCTLCKTNALLLHVAIKDLKLRNMRCSAPVLSYSKLLRYADQLHPDCILDNGRILSMDGTAHIWVTELDMILIHRQYTGQMQFLPDCYAAPKGKLPTWYRNRIMKYYGRKCTLKHADPHLYRRSKENLNGMYGMSAQRLVREDVIYNAGEWSTKKPAPDDRQSQMEKEQRKKSAFLNFAWGTWITAYARYALFRCIELIGYDKFLYCDTDSIFYLMDEQTESAYTLYNEQITDKAQSAGATIGPDNVLGRFTVEADAPIQQFRFIHAKCYALVDKAGKLSVTVAGVTKIQRHSMGLPKKDQKTNADELGNIDRLAPGFIFNECGGTRIVYNNTPLHTISVNGCEIETGASAVIMDTVYKVQDADSLAFDDEQQQQLIGGYVSDTYGDWAGIK